MTIVYSLCALSSWGSATVWWGRAIDFFIFKSIKFVRIARVDRRNPLALSFKSFGTLRAQKLLENDGIPGVGAEQSIGDISKERDQSNTEIQDNVDIHLHLYVCRKSTFHLLTRSEDHESHECINDISNTIQELVISHGEMENRGIRWNYTNNRAPAKPYSTEIEETHIQAICSSFDLCENLSIMFRDTSW